MCEILTVLSKHTNDVHFTNRHFRIGEKKFLGKKKTCRFFVLDDADFHFEWNTFHEFFSRVCYCITMFWFHK